MRKSTYHIGGMFLVLSSLAFGKTVMKIGHAQPTNTPRHESLLKFKEIVEKESNGEIEVKIYPSGQLGNESELIEGTKMGTIQGARTGMFDQISKEFLVYTLPFLFTSPDNFQKLAKSPIGDEIGKTAEKNNLVVLATGDAGGFRNLTNNKKPVKSPEDMKGLKIRTAGVETVVKFIEAMGANPVSIPYGETYMALKTGVADGQENPFINIQTMKFDEVQKNMTVFNYQIHPDPFYVNKKWFDKLNPEQQNLLKTAARTSMDYSDELMTKGNDEALQKIKTNLQVQELTPAEIEKFRTASQPVYDYFVKDKKYFSQDLVDKIRKFQEQ